MTLKNQLLIILAIVAFASGAVDQYFYPANPAPPSGLWAALLGAVLIFAWYRLDSSERGYRRSPWLNVGVAVLAVLVLPIYFFRSRGAKGGFVATGLFIALLLGYSLLGAAGQQATYHGLQS